MHTSLRPSTRNSRTLDLALQARRQRATRHEACFSQAGLKETAVLPLGAEADHKKGNDLNTNIMAATLPFFGDLLRPSRLDSQGEPIYQRVETVDLSKVVGMLLSSTQS